MAGQTPTGFINFAQYLSANNPSGYLANQDEEEKNAVSGDTADVSAFGAEASAAGTSDADAAEKQAKARDTTEPADTPQAQINTANVGAIAADPLSSAASPNYTGGSYGSTLQKINADQTKFMNPAAQFSQNGPLDAALLGGGSKNFASYGGDFRGMLGNLTSAEGNYGTAYGAEYAKDNTMPAPGKVGPQTAEMPVNTHSSPNAGSPTIDPATGRPVAAPAPRGIPAMPTSKRGKR